MFRAAGGNLPETKGLAEFIGQLNDLPPALRDFFAPGGEIFVARAPGRLDVMGGIADYSGSLVLEMPIAEATFAAVQKFAERKIKIVSLAEGEFLTFEMRLADFEENGAPVSYEEAHAYFSRNPADHWAAYVAGGFLTLMRERRIVFRSGAAVLVQSNVPPGKGVSSSAALEAATLLAVCAAFEIGCEPREAALLCQKTENLIVGAPCGVMDQMTVVCGEESRLLALLCQPAEVLATIRIPAGIEFWGVDSGVRHAVTGADYGAVRVGAFMGYRIIAALAGFETEAAGNNLVKIRDARWGGFLANISPSEYEQYFARRLPDEIAGAEFLERYGGTTDAVTKINPEKIYAVRMPTAHAVYEHFRVSVFGDLLKTPVSETSLKLLGELMYQSHASYAACGLCEAGTNRLVELVREKGGAKDLYGAKITGGGSGGTVAVMGRAGERSAVAVAEVAGSYRRQTGLDSYVFRGSSAGAAGAGVLKLKKDW